MKCSLKKHEEIEANTYCTKCENFMCKKCEIIHSDLFDSKHSSFLISLNNSDKKGKDIAPKIIEENIKYLKYFSNNLKEINDNLKNELEKINKKREELEINIQNIFTKIRNELNKVEDEYLNEIENKYNKINLDKKIKENEILLNKIKLVLNNGITQNDSLINERKSIDIKKEDNYDKLFDIEIPEEKYINDIIEKIKNLHINNEFIFDSSIIKNDLKKQNMINKWIKEKMDTNKIKYELI